MLSDPWVKWIDFGDMGGECRLKVDGVVIMTMWWQFGMGLFREHVREVSAPVWHGNFQGHALLGNLGGDGNLINGLIFLPQLAFPEAFVDLSIGINA